MKEIGCWMLKFFMKSIVVGHLPHLDALAWSCASVHGLVMCPCTSIRWISDDLTLALALHNTCIAFRLSTQSLSEQLATLLILGRSLVAFLYVTCRSTTIHLTHDIVRLVDLDDKILETIQIACRLTELVLKGTMAVHVRVFLDFSHLLMDLL